MPPKREKYYSPDERKTYLAELPAGYQGQFGPGIKSLAIVQYFACNMSEPKILEFFSHFGIQISAGELSNWLVREQPALHAAFRQHFVKTSMVPPEFHRYLIHGMEVRHAGDYGKGKAVTHEESAEQIARGSSS